MVQYASNSNSFVFLDVYQCSFIIVLYGILWHFMDEYTCSIVNFSRTDSSASWNSFRRNPPGYVTGQMNNFSKFASINYTYVFVSAIIFMGFVRAVMELLDSFFDWPKILKTTKTLSFQNFNESDNI